MVVMTETQDYIPGMCNINRAEIAYRCKAGYISLLILIVIAALLFTFDAPNWTRLVLFVPFFLTIISFLQAKKKFCVSYGASGKQNATEGSKAATAVNPQDALADKKRARQLNVQAAAVAAVLSVLAFLVP